MQPNNEQLNQQRALLLTEAADLETRAALLRSDALKIEGVIMFLTQQEEIAKSQTQQKDS